MTRLLATEADLVVTITAPLNRQRPNNDQDRIKLRNLVAEAKTRLQQDSSDAAPAVLRHLEDATAAVDLGAGAVGYIVIATPDRSETHMLAFPVAEAVTLATTPATRSLIRGLTRSPRYRLLVVSDKASRLFDGERENLHEVTDHGFPFAGDLVPRDLRAIAGKFARKPGGDDKEQWRNFYRDVDDALSAAIGGDSLPIVLAGVDVSVALFKDVSVNTESVIGRISGAQEDTAIHSLGANAWPLLRDHLEARRHQAITELSESIHTQRAVTGIDEVWQFAREGRGQTLVVEENYRAEPAREVDNRLVLCETGTPGSMEDPIDELIEHVLRSRGTIKFVADDALADLGRVGLMLR